MKDLIGILKCGYCSDMRNIFEIEITITQESPPPPPQKKKKHKKKRKRKNNFNIDGQVTFSWLTYEY